MYEVDLSSSKSHSKVKFPREGSRSRLSIRVPQYYRPFWCMMIYQKSKSTEMVDSKCQIEQISHLGPTKHIFGNVESFL